MSAPAETLDAPSAFFEHELSRLLEAAGTGPVLDLACGRGRHAIAAAEAGLDVVALDRNLESLARLRSRQIAPPGSLRVIAADVEAGPDGAPTLPFPDESFSGVLVFRYLHRPLMARIERVLRPGGLLLYETFTTRQRSLGWGPTRDAFLLEPGELPGLFPHLETIAYEDGPSWDVKPAESARLVARRPA